MSAAAIIISERPKPAAAVAFGSVLDLVRLHSEPAQAEVCEACQTINARHARLCKSCDGKLPAYFASADGEPHSSPLLSESGAEPPRSRYALFALVGLWGIVTAVALILVHGTRDVVTPSRPLAHTALPARIDRVVARVDPPAAAETARLGQSLVEVSAMPSEAAAPPRLVSPGLVEPAALEPADADRPAEPIMQPSKARTSTPVTRSGSARNIAAAGPVARCAGLNFIARAVCMSNQCARPELRRSEPCAETVRQQTLGEARRNPKLLG